MKRSVKVQFWGTRGSLPRPGAATVRYGGNTSCVQVTAPDGTLLVLDCGSGAYDLGKALQAGAPGPLRGNLLISHTHWDHIQGFPFFAPLVGPQSRHNRFVVVGQKRVGGHLEAVLANQIVEPYLPFAYAELTADIHVKEVRGGEVIVVGDDTTVRMSEIRHPGGCLGFRIENQDHVVTYCTDSSHDDDQLTASVLELARGADLLIHDAQFSLEDRLKFAAYGHSSWLEAATVAREAKAKCLALFHYDPNASDDYMESILAKTREHFPNTILAREGLEVNLPLAEGELP
jgi:ribonuclease BN (tRNA processing enzyme)